MRLADRFFASSTGLRNYLQALEDMRVREAGELVFRQLILQLASYTGTSTKATLSCRPSNKRYEEDPRRSPIR